MSVTQSIQDNDHKHWFQQTPSLLGFQLTGSERASQPVLGWPWGSVLGQLLPLSSPKEEIQTTATKQAQQETGDFGGGGAL